MKQKIQSITEAFSMQPESFYVGQTISSMSKITNTVAKIEHEAIQVSNGGLEYYYVGYDSNNNKLFQYLATSVNVHFYYDNNPK